MLQLKFPAPENFFFFLKGSHGDVIKSKISEHWTESITNIREIKAAWKNEIPQGGLNMKN